MNVGRPTSQASRAGVATPWKPTHAYVRASVTALVLTAIAVLAHRPDLLVIATPMIIVAAGARLGRPATTPTVTDRIGNAVVREGDASVQTITIRDAPEIEMLSVSLPQTPWLQTEPANGVFTANVTTNTIDLTIPMRSTRWGRRMVDPTHMVVYAPWLGFESRMKTQHAALVTMPVPAVFDVAAPMRPTDGLVGLHRSSRTGEGAEFASIRPFSTGDRMRRINWPRSMRDSQLQVNATWADHDTHVAFVIDAMDDLGTSEGIDGTASSLDTTVRAASAIAEHFSRRGDRFSLRVFGSVSGLTVPPATGPRHLRRFLDTLTQIRSSGASHATRDTMALRGSGGPSLTVMLSPLISRSALDRAVALARQGQTVIVVDTLPDQLTTDDDPYTALAWRIRRLDRRREIRRVQTAGIPVVRWLGAGSLDTFLRDIARRAAAPRMRVGS